MLNFKKVALTFIVLFLNNILLCYSASCSSYTDEPTCIANPSCSWIFSSSYYCACASPVPQDVYFVMDASGSVGLSGWTSEKTFVSNMITSGLTNSSRAGVIVFASGAWTKINFTNTQHPRSTLTTTVNALGYNQGSTYTKTAVNLAISMFKKYSTLGYARIMMLITDGVPSPASQGPCSLKSTLDSQNITAVIVAVGNSIDTSLVECLVNDESSQIIYASTFNSFDSIRTYTDSFLCPSTISVILTEFRIDTDATSNAKFLEFYAGSSIDLATNPLVFSGYVRGTIDDSIIPSISLGQYVVLYKSGTSPNCEDCSCPLNSAGRCTNAIYIACDGINCTIDQFMDNENFTMTIKDGSDSSQLVSISYSSSWPSVYSGYSFELQDIGLDDTKGINWAQSCWDYGTPGQEPLSYCSSCLPAVCQANGDSSAICDNNQCDCSENDHYYSSASSCYSVPTVTDCATLLTADEAGKYVVITWGGVHITTPHFFYVTYPFDGSTLFGTTPENQNFWLYYDLAGTVTEESTPPQVQTLVVDNTSSVTLNGQNVVYGTAVSCPISIGTAAPTIPPTPAPTVAVPVIPSCTLTITGYHDITVEWDDPIIDYPTTPESISEYIIFFTCDGVSQTYTSSSQSYSNYISWCTLSTSTVTSIKVAASVDDANGEPNIDLMTDAATICSVVSHAPTYSPTSEPTPQPTNPPIPVPTLMPTQRPTVDNWVVTSCVVTIKSGGLVSISYTENTPIASSNPRTIEMYDSNLNQISQLSSNPAVFSLSVSPSDTTRFKVYPQFAQYPGGPPNYGESCCGSVCSIATLSPTLSPTQAPTKVPTPNPTGRPTALPTALPTNSPTDPVYSEIAVEECFFAITSGYNDFTISFYEPLDYTFPIEDAIYQVSWNDQYTYSIPAQTEGGFIQQAIASPDPIDISAGIFVTIYYLTLQPQGEERFCTGTTPSPSKNPTRTPTTPSPTWSDAFVAFDSSQFTEESGCSYTEDTTPLCTITPSSIPNSLRVLRSPSTWGYGVSFHWSIIADDTSYFSGDLEGWGTIGTTTDFETFEYTLSQTSETETTMTFIIEIDACDLDETDEDIPYICSVTNPYQVQVTVDFTSDAFRTKSGLGDLPEWIWYVLAACVLLIPFLSYFGYRYYNKRKLALLLKETKQEELQEMQELDDAGNFGGLGDDVTFNPLATGGAVDIATGGQYIDSQLETQKQQFETATVDVDVMTFKQDFGQVLAGQN